MRLIRILALAIVAVCLTLTVIPADACVGNCECLTTYGAYVMTDGRVVKLYHHEHCFGVPDPLD